MKNIFSKSQKTNVKTTKHQNNAPELHEYHVYDARGHVWSVLATSCRNAIEKAKKQVASDSTAYDARGYLQTGKKMSTFKVERLEPVGAYLYK